MNNMMYQRIIKEGIHLTNTDKTIRQIAKDFNISKSTVHKDLTERLPKIDYILSKQVEEKLENHLATRHIKGGLSTKLRYKRLK